MCTFVGKTPCPPSVISVKEGKMISGMEEDIFFTQVMLCKGSDQCNDILITRTMIMAAFEETG